VKAFFTLIVGTSCRGAEQRRGRHMRQGIVVIRLAALFSAGGVSAGAATGGASTPLATAASTTAFMSPSRNIHCRYFPSAATIGCLTLNNRIETMMRSPGQPFTQNVSHGFPSGPVLAYGKSRSFGGQFKCSSRKDGVFCRSLSAERCFLVTRDGSKLTCGKQTSTSTLTSTPTPNCHPSYVGACLNPNASDYDCAGGSGNGPYYTGPVRVVGPDEFGLDADGDGYACEG
jgi:hypothetical protein